MSMFSIAGKIGPLARKAYVRHRNARWFMETASDDSEVKVRHRMLREFRNIDRQLRCLHSEGEILFMADCLLRNSVSGPMVECGCYQGGSSAKLSLVARVLSKQLYICDSFQGLPAVPEDDGVYHQIDGQLAQFKSGEFAASLATVEANIRRLGDISRCEFVAGLFADALVDLEISPCFVFMDVDLISSARDCIRYLWPRLRSGAKFFTHEALYAEFVTGIMNPQFWKSHLNQSPPILFGAGFGCGFDAGCLAYFEKPCKTEGPVEADLT